MDFLGLTRVPIYSLDLSDQSFKFLRLRDSANGVVVEKFGEGPIDKGVLEMGEIKDKNRLSEILNEVFSKNKIEFVALSLPEEKGFLRKIRISGVSESDLFSALQFQLEDHVPLKAEDAIFDYAIIEKGSDYFDLVINAFHRDVVESYLGAVNSAGAFAVIAESELESVARSVIPKNFIKSALIVDWGKTRASFSVFEKGALSFASTSQLGGERLESAIAKVLGVEKKEAIKIKFETNISNYKTSPAVLNAVSPVVSELVSEIRKILDYWQDRGMEKNNLEQIFLCGGDSNLFGLSEYLEKELDISVKLANPWENVIFPQKYLPSIKFKDSLRFSSSIGLSLKAMKEEKIL